MNTSTLSVINNPEFVKLEPLEINPLISSCDIKVMYVGENRNGTIISKEVATELSKSLRGSPIVGYFREEKNDFGTHERHLVIDDEEGIYEEVLTKPYGFVAPDAKVWFQFYEDLDDLGNTCLHEYLCTTGYLWAGQFPEAQCVVDEGRPQSMEIVNVDGESRGNKFNITHAIMSKLCILGDDVEPCFEGASIVKDFSLSSRVEDENTFTETMYSMINDLKNLYNAKEEKAVMDETKDFEKEDLEQEVQAGAMIEEELEKKKVEDHSEEEKDSFEQEDVEPVEVSEEASEDAADAEPSEDYSAKIIELETELKEKTDTVANLKERNFALENEVKELREFKASIEDAQKEKMIREDFYMLDEEDVKEYLDNKRNYSLDEIEAKLAVVCKHKKVNFGGKEKEDVVAQDYTYRVNEPEQMPSAILGALKMAKDKGGK